MEVFQRLISRKSKLLLAKTRIKASGQKLKNLKIQKKRLLQNNPKKVTISRENGWTFKKTKKGSNKEEPAGAFDIFNSNNEAEPSPKQTQNQTSKKERKSKKNSKSQQKTEAKNSSTSSNETICSLINNQHKIFREKWWWTWRISNQRRWRWGKGKGKEIWLLKYHRWEDLRWFREQWSRLYFYFSYRRNKL